MVFLATYISFQLSSIGQCEQTDYIYTWKNQSCRKHSYQKLTQFSEENNMLDAPAENREFLFREINVFHNNHGETAC